MFPSDQQKTMLSYPRKTMLVIGAFLLLSFGFLGWAVYQYFSAQKAKEQLSGQGSVPQKTEQEKISESLRAPSERVLLPEEVRKSLSAPRKGKPLPKDVLESLRAPNP